MPLSPPETRTAKSSNAASHDQARLYVASHMRLYVASDIIDLDEQEHDTENTLLES